MYSFDQDSSYLVTFFKKKLVGNLACVLLTEYYPLRPSKAWANRQIKTSSVSFSPMDEHCF